MGFYTHVGENIGTDRKNKLKNTKKSWAAWYMGHRRPKKAKVGKLHRSYQTSQGRTGQGKVRKGKARRDDARYCTVRRRGKGKRLMGPKMSLQKRTWRTKQARTGFEETKKNELTN